MFIRISKGKFNKGMVIYIVAIIAVFSFLIISNLMIINHGEINQLKMTENLIKCEIASRSVYQKVSNELRVRSWNNRSFRDAPSVSEGVTDSGVKYTAIIENTPSSENQADIWITTRFENSSRVAFYRLDVQYSVFERINQVKPTFFSFFSSKEYGKKENIKRLQNKVSSIIAERLSKNKEKDIYVSKIQNSKKLSSIMNTLGIPAVGKIKQAQVPFNPDSSTGYSKSPFAMLMGDIKGEKFLSIGKIEIDRFNMIAKKKRTFLNLNVMKNMRKKYGKVLTARIMKNVEMMNTPEIPVINMLASNLKKREENSHIFEDIMKDSSKEEDMQIRKITGSVDENVIDTLSEIEELKKEKKEEKEEKIDNDDDDDASDCDNSDCDNDNDNNDDNSYHPTGLKNVGSDHYDNADVRDITEKRKRARDGRRNSESDMKKSNGKSDEYLKAEKVYDEFHKGKIFHVGSDSKMVEYRKNLKRELDKKKENGTLSGSDVEYYKAVVKVQKKKGGFFGKIGSFFSNHRRKKEISDYEKALQSQQEKKGASVDNEGIPVKSKISRRRD